MILTTYRRHHHRFRVLQSDHPQFHFKNYNAVVVVPKRLVLLLVHCANQLERKNSLFFFLANKEVNRIRATVSIDCIWRGGFWTKIGHFWFQFWEFESVRLSVEHFPCSAGRASETDECLVRTSAPDAELSSRDWWTSGSVYVFHRCCCRRLPSDSTGPIRRRWLLLQPSLVIGGGRSRLVEQRRADAL